MGKLNFNNSNKKDRVPKEAPQSIIQTIKEVVYVDREVKVEQPPKIIYRDVQKSNKNLKIALVASILILIISHIVR